MMAALMIDVTTLVVNAFETHLNWRQAQAKKIIHMSRYNQKS